jgi:D-serine deaminase-like pyridoxal phosphate-dependent protein
MPVDVLSGGSTPTAALATIGALTEIRPGVYVFGDAQQLELGTCAVGDVALTAATTVVSHAPGRVVLNAGSKILGADRPIWTTGFGRLPDYPDARLSALSEHHATVRWSGSSPLPKLGAVLRVMPNHVCAAVNLADELVIAASGKVVDRWRLKITNIERQPCRSRGHRSVLAIMAGRRAVRRIHQHHQGGAGPSSGTGPAASSCSGSRGEIARS